MTRWSLSATEAGWLIGAYFAAYVVAVPVLVALTDRVPARRVYLLGTALTAAAHLGFAVVADGFWSGLALRAVAGVGWAGCYMPGLKVIADRLEGNAQSRAVSWHAAGVGIAGAVSFGVAGLLDAFGGPPTAFLFGAAAAVVAFGIGAVVMPKGLPDGHAGASAPAALLDFRPVFRNRAAMAWIAGYTVHTWELAGCRGQPSSSRWPVLSGSLSPSLAMRRRSALAGSDRWCLRWPWSRLPRRRSCSHLAWPWLLSRSLRRWSSMTRHLRPSHRQSGQGGLAGRSRR
ncbi:MAG: MFS transporter [Rhizobiales bacterium]|nr:MFS transporter [Hyphomicrobiales bacterium]